MALIHHGTGVSSVPKSQDLSKSGRLQAPLWLVFGAMSCSLAFLGTTSWWLVGIGGLAIAVGLVCLRMDWARTPPLVGRGMPAAACTVLLVLGYVEPGRPLLVAVGIFALTTWAGIALDTGDVIAAQLLCLPVLALPAWREDGLRSAVIAVVSVWPMAIACGVGMLWLSGNLASATRSAARAQQAASQAELAGQVAAEAAERERAERTAEELAQRTRMQGEVTRHATQLSSAAQGVSSETSATALVAREMSMSIADLARTATTTDAISGSVADLAVDASRLMAKLAQSSQGIMVTSTVIAAIASQTNLLALNATIESARAGAAGRGFGVVAQEVKELARQSDESAGTITATLAQVNTDMRAAVERVEEISASMSELQRQNTMLAAAVEEQSASIANISDSVSSTAIQAQRIAEGVRELEEISRS